jgi:hypothetical protein
VQEELTLTDIRSRWNEVLDQLERTNRIAWMAFFDARLDSFSNGRLTLDYSDPSKLGSGHDYHDARVRLAPQLASVIRDVLHISVVIVEKR